MQRHDRIGQGSSGRWATVGAAIAVVVLAAPPASHALTGAIEQQAYLKASDTTGGDRFGESVAVDGDTLVVGTYFESNGEGAAYVFRRVGATWSQEARLKASTPNTSDAFGFSVDVSGDTVVVGARGRATRGAAFVFVRSGTTWTQQAELSAEHPDMSDEFGRSVAVDGDTIVVGAPYERSDGSAPTDDSLPAAGAAYVFTRTGVTWTQQAYLKASNVAADDQFGIAVDLDADTIVVGAHYEDSDGSGPANDAMSSSGAAYVFTRSGATWSEQAYLKASNAGTGDEFGGSVAVDGDVVLIGARDEDSDGTGPADDSASDAGAAYVFARTGATWSQQDYLKALDVDAGDEFGFRVGLAGDVAVVGALYEDSAATGVDGDGSDDSAFASGAAYVFTRTGPVWAPHAYLKASNTGAGDGFGVAVAIDATSIVVGANLEDSSATGVDGDQSDDSASAAGAAYVFAAPVVSSGGVAPASGPRLTVGPDPVVAGAPLPASVAGADPGVAFLWRLSDGSGAALAEGDVTVDGTGSGAFVVPVPSGIGGPVTLELVAWGVRTDLVVSGPVPSGVPAGDAPARWPVGLLGLLAVASVLVLTRARRVHAEP